MGRLVVIARCIEGIFCDEISEASVIFIPVSRYKLFRAELAGEIEAAGKDVKSLFTYPFQKAG